ncbi:MAG: PKD domain-containing protein, partial [bacterium]|nr:PKD domain-containing protein [bacterium]
MQNLNLFKKGSLWLILSLLVALLTVTQAQALTTTMALVPSTINVCVGNTFTVNIEVSGMDAVDTITSLASRVQYDTTALLVVTVMQGTGFSNLVNTAPNPPDTYPVVLYSRYGGLDTSDSGILAIIIFQALTASTTNVILISDTPNSYYIDSTDSSNFDTYSNAPSINIGIQADFTVSTTTPCSGTQVSFSDSSTGTITSYLWNFGDGGNSSDSNPAHIYATTNPCTVTLMVSGPCGTDTETKVAYINPVALPEANFTANNQTPCSGTSVHFTSNCTGTVDTYSWNFGDGNNSSDSNPAHIYATTNPCT